MSIHDFDMARYLSASEVEEVYAQGAVLIDPAIGDVGDHDTAVIRQQFIFIPTKYIAIDCLTCRKIIRYQIYC